MSHSEKGKILVITFYFNLFLWLVVGGLGVWTIRSAKNASQIQKKTIVHYYSEAGIEKTTYLLYQTDPEAAEYDENFQNNLNALIKMDIDSFQPFNKLELGEGEITVSIERFP